MRFGKTIAIILACTASLSLLSGCSINLGLTREQPAEEEVAYEPIVVKNQRDLDEGMYYVKHGDTFSQLYMGKATFAEDESAESADPTKVLWFQDDFAKIPTYYSGDTLIYTTRDDLNREFGFERYNYLGYTIGVSNLQKTLSGRYAVEATEDGLDAFCPGSDAEKLLSVGGTPVVIDRIGNGDLRSGNISEAGTILGLSKDKVYEAEVYVGSEITYSKIKADVIAMFSSDYQASVNYSYLQSNIIEIPIPENFNTGYYKMSDGGVFRYVKGSSYDENVDFNVANMTYEDYLESQENEESNDGEESNAEEKAVMIEKDGNYVITVVFSKDNVNDDLPEAEATLAGSDQSSDLERQSNGDLKFEGDLTKGDYTINIRNLYGRKYTVQLEEVVS